MAPKASAKAGLPVCYGLVVWSPWRSRDSQGREDVADEEEAEGEWVPRFLHPCCQQVPPQTHAAPCHGQSSVPGPGDPGREATERRARNQLLAHRELGSRVVVTVMLEVMKTSRRRRHFELGFEG